MTANTLQDFLKEEESFFDSLGIKDSTADENTLSVSDIFSRPIDLGPDESPMSTSFSPDDQQLHEKRKSEQVAGNPSKIIKSETPNSSGQVGQRVGKKPGRKADPNEPENKRKAQNRQAQRAFRERKEKHLKDLEDKVKQLEDEAAATNNENEFLRQQVKRLQGELKRYKNNRLEQSSLSSDASDPTGSRPFTFEFPFFSSTGDSSSNGISSAQSERQRQQRPSQQQPEKQSLYKEQQQQRHINDISTAATTAATSTSTSTTATTTPSQDNSNSSISSSNNSSVSLNSGLQPLHRNSLPSQSPNSTSSLKKSSTEDSPGSALSSPYSFKETSNSSYTTPSSILDANCNGCNNNNNNNSNNNNNNNNKVQFGGITNTESFCDSLSRACGSKDRPVPREGSKSGQSPASLLNGTSMLPWTSPANSHKDILNSKTPSTASVFSPNSFELDFLGEYRDPLFDGEEFSLPELPTAEYSLFDPLENPIANTAFESMKNPTTAASISSVAPLVTSTTSSSDASSIATARLGKDDEETVPASDAKMMTCSAVWDRICSHPKFGDIDIDGLCYELRSKAKCSDGGVLLTENDVDKVLENFH